jgi:diguanylate cyclase (GGDEF)-like protein/PAS domain S-box-containing protein
MNQANSVRFKVRELLWMAAVAIGYVLLAKVVLGFFSANGVVSIVWPSSGLALAALLIGGNRYLPALFVGALIANVVAGLPLGLAAAIAAGNTMEAFAGAWLVTRGGKFDSYLGSLPDYLRLVFLAGFAACCVAALGGSTALLISGFVTSAQYLENLIRWWLGDVLGIVLITPVILTWRRAPDGWRNPRRIAEFLFMFALLFVASQLVFLDLLHRPNGIGEQIFGGYWMFLVIVIVAIRFQVQGVALALVTTATLALNGAVQGAGHFAHNVGANQLVTLWFYIMVLSAVGMVVATYHVERKQAEQARSDSEEQYRLLITTMPEGVTLQDENSRILAFNQSAERILGLTGDQLTGKSSFDANWRSVHEDGSPFLGETHPVVQTLATGLPQSDVIMGIHKPTGELVWISINVTPIFKEGKTKPYRVVATMHDITERKLAEERIERLAHFDQLTSLPNRTLLNDHFKYALSLAQRNHESLAVMFLDLDHFKNINDALGHGIGDQVLVEAAKRLKATLREQDTLSRLGGDEFILILPATNADGAAQLAAKLIEVVSQPCLIEQHELSVTPSLGIAIYPDDGTSLELLSRNADTAMYRAKQEGRNSFRFYTPAMQEHSARNLSLANALRHALERDELQLHYQPQISIKDGRIIGAEALLRWRHPELGMVSPAEFIPVAESSGHIISIGEWVMRTATQQLKHWLDLGLPPMVMAVNLSAVQFRQKDLPGRITRILDEVTLPHHYLELELTEAAAMDDPQAAIAMMDALSERGIRMSIDDFGTGYSSLSLLKKFKVYKLKIDQSFVRDLTDDPEDKAIVTAIINMANGLGLQTIAEGVETAGQLEFLRLQGCIEAQGYYFSRPLPADQFEEFVRKQ